LRNLCAFTVKKKQF